MEIDLKNYIEGKIQELEERLFPIFTTDIKKPSVVYFTKPISGGYVKQSQLELRIVWNDYDKCKMIEKSIVDIMDFKEDDPFVIYGNTRFRSELAGGGCIYNSTIQMFEVTNYYIITWRNTKWQN